MGVIYSILNKLNGKIYVGQTSRPFKRRVTEHKSKLRGQNHRNPHLQNAWNKYGDDAFVFNILEHCSDDTKLTEYEDWWIDFFGSTNPFIGYNMQRGSDSRGTCSQDFRDKMSEVTKGENNGNWGNSLIEDYGGLWFLETMATTGISITKLGDCIGLDCSAINGYLARRGTSWSEISVTVTESPQNKLHDYGGVDFLKDCVRNKMTQKQICDEYGLGTENVIYRFLKMYDYSWKSLKQEVAQDG